MTVPRADPIVRWAIFLGVAGVALFLLIDLCEVVYRCGCRALWHGAAVACNIHQPQPPHCPWCAAGWWGFVIPAGVVLSAQAFAVFTPGPMRPVPRALLALALFPITGALVALLFGLAMGYWRG